MGPLGRDLTFLRAVNILVNGGVGVKPNSLYLMKIGSKIDMEACQTHITIIYKFPVLLLTDFVPKRTISVPKKINGKFFQLAEMPYMITWSYKVYSWTSEQYDECQHTNRHIFCEIPTNIQTLRENCIFALLKDLGRNIVADRCPLVYVKEPVSFVKFLDTTMVYFDHEGKTEVTILCPQMSSAKPMILEESGKVTLPNGCKVQYGTMQTHTMGHARCMSNVRLELNDEVWKLNFTNYIPLMKVNNVRNISVLWDDMDTDMDERILEQGVSDVFDQLKLLQFSPEGLNITVWSLIGYAIIAAFFIILCFYCTLVPNALLCCRSICCCCCVA